MLLLLLGNYIQFFNL